MTTIVNWSETSEKYLKSLNGDLRAWCNEVRNISDLQFEVTEGRRSKDRQYTLWEHGEVAESSDSPYCRGLAVNLMITIHQIPCFSPEIYLELAQCGMFASKNTDIGVFWGATGGIDLRKTPKAFEELFLENQIAHSGDMITQNQRLQYFELV